MTCAGWVGIPTQNLKYYCIWRPSKTFLGLCNWSSLYFTYFAVSLLLQGISSSAYSPTWKVHSIVAWFSVFLRPVEGRTAATCDSLPRWGVIFIGAQLALQVHFASVHLGSSPAAAAASSFHFSVLSLFSMWISIRLTLVAFHFSTVATWRPGPGPGKSFCTLALCCFFFFFSLFSSFSYQLKRDLCCGLSLSELVLPGRSVALWSN